ncbi:MAG: ABA4-like family protein [Pseudomonadota bacterium]
MTWETAYLIINLLVLPAWAMLIFLPRSKLTNGLVHSAFYPVLMGAIYAAALIAGMFFGQSAEGGGFSTLGAVMAIFDHPNGVIIGWTHYLVFDLFVGAWIGRDAARLSMPHLLVIPCLLGAFIFGPVGLLLYLLMRGLVRGKWGLTV